MNTIYSGIFKLNARDLGNGLAIVVIGTLMQAIFGAATGGVHSLLSAAFWSATLDLDIKAAGLYLSKNLLSDTQGNLLGIGSLSAN